MNNYKKYIIYSLIAVLLIIFWFIQPSELFKDPFCTVIIDKNNKLLGAHIAADGQYRFPVNDKVSAKFEKSIITFEDKRFEYHWGFDLPAFFRALKQNIENRKIVSGGSTLTMQVIRLSRRGKKRTFTEKIIEIILAIRLEFSYSKPEILAMYASHAPFGGNVVGIDAAAWRYFATYTDKLTWAESATLAVLPNAPSLIYPGKNRNKLLKKRNRLLKKLCEEEIIDKETYELALEEPIPEKPNSFPNIAPHLLARINLKNKKSGIVKTTISSDIQVHVNQIIKKHNRRLSANYINNAAAIVVDVKTGNVVTYTGNISDFTDNINGNHVDMITAERSTGSILKPFLYASMLTSGDILPDVLVYDIPTRIGNYTPKNYGRGYDGAVPAHFALARSLNIPAVRMLRKYGVERFYNNLERIGMSSLHNPPSHYGLSLILGGCETSLWELSGIYASMARSLNNFYDNGERYDKNDYKKPNFYFNNNFKEADEVPWVDLEKNSVLSASALWLTFYAMLDVERPDNDNNWRYFESSELIAWKTGTSFGFRDAWAIGITPKYVVAVWAGNADGEGRPALIGIKAAAPILFDIFNILPDAPAWFKHPKSDMTEIEICNMSGYPSNDICVDVRKTWVPKTEKGLSVCPYHKIIHLDKNEKYRVNADCEDIDNIVSKAWFILPPTVENYYKTKNATYKYLPPVRSDCMQTEESNVKNMELIYPFYNSKIFVPLELDGTMGRTVFEATHRKKSSTIFWYIDKKLIGETADIHKIELRPEPGEHTLTMVDENGEKLIRKFEIIKRD